jgi:Domain of unknown function (DUF2703)
MSTMTIEVLYVSGCPNHSRAVRAITRVLKECGLEEQITQIKVTDRDHAIALAFPGSPTVRINGADIEPELPQLNSYGVACRTYLVNGKRQGIPHRNWIYDAICGVASRNGSR